MSIIFNSLPCVIDGQIKNPYGKQIDGTWYPGFCDVSTLNTEFGQYSTATELAGATTSIGLKLFFADLAKQGLISS